MTSGDLFGRPSSQHVCLERCVEVGAGLLRVRDWPGLGGPLVHTPDPLRRSGADLLDALGAALPPRFRVLSVQPRANNPYQVAAADLLAVVEQFGFTAPVLIGEGLGCLTALLVAAWHPAWVAGLVLVEPTQAALSDDGLAARALRDCPPDWPALQRAVQCPLLVRRADARLVPDVETLLATIASESGG